MKKLILLSVLVNLTFSSSASPATVQASWYQCCKVTATGENFDPDGFSAAHRTLPFGTILKVTRVSTGDFVVVRVNDRGPYVDGRGIDLSRGAARALGCIEKGICSVTYEILY